MTAEVILRHPNGDCAILNPFGAELSRWRAFDTDLIWRKDPKIWDQTAPVLFPIVGWTRNNRVKVKDCFYPLKLHGFAWKKNFSITQQDETHVRLTLLDDAETRALYPFRFRFDTEVILAEGVLHYRLSISNRDDQPLPYACGLHPAFCWPLGGSFATHRILFEKKERPDIPLIREGGLFSRATRRIPLHDRQLTLTPDLFAQEALCFLDINSSHVIYDNGAGQSLFIELERFPHLALWSKAGDAYVCIEAWTGYGDPEDFAGDLYEKPSMQILSPGATQTHSVTFKFQRN
ncbi:MAG: aldose 1-epimerase family protein [Methylocystis sp.]|nr:aldose 1-epimerase family protein [Alphaproteobacteria bacterium]